MAAFLLDHNVSSKLVPLLYVRGHTATTARAVQMDSAGDERILLAAATQERILVTHNIKDFQLLHDAWHLWSRTWGVKSDHMGILIIPDYHRWIPIRAAREIDTFIAQEFSLTNTLYEWKARDGWQRRPQPPE